jgi:NADH:ubiquinone oxidoreductase subunit 4 (subunit M)
MDNLLSIVTFLPLVAALIMAVFLRGDDEAAQLNAKRLAFAATLATFLVSIFILVQFDPGERPGSSWWSRRSGSSACNTRWASTGSACCS